MAGIRGGRARGGAADRRSREEALTLAIALFGTGALASLVGARLARAGSDVTLIGAWSAGLEAVARDGIRVEEPSGTWTARPGAERLGRTRPRASLVLVLVKSTQTERVAAAVAEAAREDGIILTLQNGLGNRERLVAAAGRGSVALGVAFLGATLIAPGHVRVGGGDRLVLERHARLEEAAERLRAAGFETSVVDDIQKVVWQKLVANCAINPLTALHRVPNGALLDGGELQRVLEAAAREVGSVARALGVELGEDPAAIALGVARATAANRSSMLQDVERGTPTEIDALNGAVVRQAAALGVDVPVNRQLEKALRERCGEARGAR